MNHSKLYSKLLVATLALAFVSLTAFAQDANAKNIECIVGVAKADKGSRFGYKMEEKETEIVLRKQPSANYIGTSTVEFSDGYRVSVAFEVGENDLANTWSSIVTSFYKVEAGRNKFLGGVSMNNTYYGPDMIAPQDIWIGSADALDKVANEPGVLNLKDFNLLKLAPMFADGQVIGAGMVCNPK